MKTGYVLIIFIILVAVITNLEKPEKVNKPSDQKVDYSKVDADLSSLYNTTLISDQKKIDVANFILNTEDYKKNGKDLTSWRIYDSSDYCKDCKLIKASYKDKFSEESFYYLDILVEGNGSISVLSIEKDPYKDVGENAEKLLKPYSIERGQSLHDLTLDPEGHIKYKDYVIPATIDVYDLEKDDNTVRSEFDNLLVFNFPKYNKIYFIACMDWQEKVDADHCPGYVFNTKNKSLVETDYQKYFSPFPPPLEFSPNGRYLAMRADQDDGIMFTVFDIEQNKYIGKQGFREDWNMYDFHFIDNENFTYKYKVSTEKAGQEQVMIGNIHSMAEY